MKKRQHGIGGNILLIGLFVCFIFIFIGLYMAIKENNGLFSIIEFVLFFISAITTFILFGSLYYVSQYDKCHIKPYLIFLERNFLRKQKKLSHSIRLQLIDRYLLVGELEQCALQIKELESTKNRLTDIEKIDFEINKIKYFYFQDNMLACKNEIILANQKLEDAKKISIKRKRVFQNNINFYSCLVDEKWSEAIRWMENLQKEKRYFSDTYSQVVIAHHFGVCYANLGNVERAYEELQFVTKWGGDTIYAIHAKEMLLALPRTEAASKRNVVPIYRNRIIFCLLLIALNTTLAIGLNYFVMPNFNLSTPDTIEKAYCRSYHISNVDNIQIFYEAEIGDYTMAIIGDRRQITYCFFELNKYKLGNRYSIINAYSYKYMEEIPGNAIFLYDIFGKSDEKEEAIKFDRQSDIYYTLKVFYGCLPVSGEDIKEYVGIVYDYPVKKILIDGKEAEIKLIDVNGKQNYMWIMQSEDMKNVNLQNNELLFKIEIID